MNTSRTLLLVAFAFAAVLSHAQAPQAFNYQAVARDAAGDPISDQSIGVKFLVHQGSPTGPVVYAETHSATTNDHGLFTLQVGNGTPDLGTFAAIEWRTGNFFLDVQANLGAGYISMGTQQLLSVPYALHAGSSSNVPNGTEVGQIMHWDGAAWVADSGLYVYQKRFGIGQTEPDSPLGIQAQAGGKLFSVTGQPTPVGEASNEQYRLTMMEGGTSTGLSIEQDTTGGSVSRLFIQSGTGNVGIGTQDPPAPLAIVSKSVLKQFFQTGDFPTQSQFGFTQNDTTGFGIDQGIPGSMTSRLFIQSSSGNVGIGTTGPEAPLAIKSRDYLYEKFQNGDIPDEQDFVISSGGNTGLSIDQDTTGGSVSRLFIQSGTGHVGIGSDDPPAALAIETRETLKTYFETGDVPTADQFGISTDSIGLSIGQGGPDSQQSRIFIQSSTGNVGIGTSEPDAQLEVFGHSQGSNVGILLRNSASTANEGWSLGHVDDDAVPAGEGSLRLSEVMIGHNSTRRLTVLPGGNVGINEELPDVKLHVSRDLAEPGAALDLIEGTGIAVIGPITNNIVVDYRGIQARTGSYPGGGTTLALTASDLNLQRLGGNILIHGDSNVDLSQKAIITTDAKLGLGTITPAEKIDIDGAIKIGNSSNQEDGTIRWTGTDFEGRKGGSWNSLTTHTNTDGLWQGGSPGEISYAPAGVDARVGIGTNTPVAKLHVTGASDGGDVSIMLENTASSPDGGWLMSAVDDNAVPERMKTLAIHEKTGADLVERITVLSGGNVGINEEIPDTKLHVSRPASDPGAATSLDAGSGIACFGDIIDSNLNLDDDGIQARSPAPLGSPHVFTWNTLNLQRLGGDILIHGDDALGSNRVTVTGDGKIGVGKTAIEKLEINGAIVVGNTDNVAPASGTIRWNTASSDLEGFVGTAWTSLTGGGWQKVDNTDVIVAAGDHPKVGIGTSQPNASLRVDSWAAVVERSTGVHFQNTSTTSSSDPADNRVGLQIENTGTWGGDPSSKNIGLYVSEVSGQSEASSNIAAVLNGNVVIGDVTSGQAVGAGGSRMFVIQNRGGVPSGVPNNNIHGGIQIFSDDIPGGGSTFHLMTGDGSVIKLYRQADMTPADGSAVGPVYDPTTAALIENMRTRINQLEAALQNLGLLPPAP